MSSTHRRRERGHSRNDAAFGRSASKTMPSPTSQNPFSEGAIIPDMIMNSEQSFVRKRVKLAAECIRKGRDKEAQNIIIDLHINGYISFIAIPAGTERNGMFFL